jgi:hypothetical protein
MDNRTETGGSRVDFMPDVSTEGGANYAWVDSLGANMTQS